MGAHRAPRTPLTRRRHVAVLVCALLTTLTVLAPALAHGVGHSTHHLRAVQTAALASAGQGVVTLRVDQPATVAAAAQRSPEQPASRHRDNGNSVPEQPDVEAARSRGPPGAR